MKAYKREEFLYVGEPQLDNQSWHVLTHLGDGDPSTENDMRIEITKFKGGYWGIKSVRHNAWIYAGEPNLNDEKKHVLCFNGAGDPMTDNNMRWSVEKMNEGWAIKSVSFDKYVTVSDDWLETDAKRFVTLDLKDNATSPVEDLDKRWVFSVQNENDGTFREYDTQVDTVFA